MCPILFFLDFFLFFCFIFVKCAPVRDDDDDDNDDKDDDNDDDWR